ncbi:MAG: hypothetical protein M3Q08_03485 [Pseudomonadota bacterium]|nr:hypothetical protein [Pseudomonadota bacterium]
MIRAHNRLFAPSSNWKVKGLVATPPPQSYLPIMRFNRLFSLLMLLALLLAPAAMLGNHAAMAAPSQAKASTSGHCSEQQQQEGSQKESMIDCGIACTALPAYEPLLADKDVALAAAPEASPSLLLDGSRPEAATPPPRFS